MSLPAVAVVLPVLNHRRTLGAVLDALERTTWPDLAIVAVDCGSVDGSLDLLRERAHGAPRLTVVERPGSGRASALNAGFAAAGGRDVVRLHADVVPDSPEWLELLHAVAAKRPDCGVVGAKITLASGRIQSCGRDLINGLGIVPEWSDRRWLEFDREEPSDPTEVDGVTGELCYVRREVLRRTGGLDSNYDPVFGDDDDFCLLARWHGYRVFVEPAARGVHFAPRQTTMTGPISDPTGTLQRMLGARGELQRAFRDYFRAKWGFDPAAPDLHEVRRRYGDTRICWRIGDRLREELPAEPAVDVCFPTWNSMAVLPRAMAHLAATRWRDVRVWITDNGSTDGTCDYLERLGETFPFPLHVERLRQNIGCAQALNLAIERGSAPLVARLDDDTIVAPDWLEKLAPRFRQRPYAAVIGPKVLHDSDRPALQSGPSRQWPAGFPVGPDEPDRASCLARAVTLRGCCNLYRRSVFAEVGLLDPRFSPSQFDEWDHHVSLAVRGYEVLYDGSTAVRHLLTAGRMATPAAMANFYANLQKSNGKWGGEHFARLERAIDLSIDGRFLPRDGDTGALRERLPAVPAGPPRQATRDAGEIARWSRVARRRSLMRAAGGPLIAFLEELVTIGEEALDEGRHGAAAAVVRQVMDLGCDSARGLAFLARYRALDGDPDSAGRTARWARLLDPGLEPESGAAELELPRPPARPASAPNRGGDSARVLLLASAERGDHDVDLACDVTAAALTAAGAEVAIDASLAPDAAGFDVAHAFGLGQATTLLGRVQCARATNPAVRIALSSLRPDPGAANWIGEVLGPHCRAPDDELRALLAAAAGEGARHVPDDPHGPAVDYERALLGFVDAWIVHTEAEGRWLRARHPGVLPPTCLAEGVGGPPPADPATAAACDVAAGSVIQVGPRDLPGNHLPLVLALQDAGVPLTLCGPPGHPYADARTARRGGELLRLCRTVRGVALAAALGRSSVLAWLPAAAPAFALPLLAARAGCELVLARGVGAEAVFGDGATYVDPLDLPALRAAILSARARWTGRRDERWRREVLAERGAACYGERLLAVYGVSSREPTRAATVDPVGANA